MITAAAAAARAAARGSFAVAPTPLPSLQELQAEAPKLQAAWDAATATVAQLRDRKRAASRARLAATKADDQAAWDAAYAEERALEAQLAQARADERRCGLDAYDNDVQQDDVLRSS